MRLTMFDRIMTTFLLSIVALCLTTLGCLAITEGGIWWITFVLYALGTVNLWWLIIGYDKLKR